MWLASFVAVFPLGLLTAAPAWADGGVVTPNGVGPGGTVTVVGNVPVEADACPLPGIVILQGIGVWADPSGFESGPYDPAGHFRVSGRLSGTVRPGPHVFMIRCAGRSEPLGPAAGAEIGGPPASATFTVTDVTRNASETGSRSAPGARPLDHAVIGFGAIALAVTALLVRRGRRRNTLSPPLRRP